MDVEQIAFTIIAHAGEAKSLAYSALREAEKNNFEKAENLIKIFYPGKEKQIAEKLLDLAEAERLPEL